jgi:putative transposase
MWESVQNHWITLGFDLAAWVILPDHLHLIIDPRDNNLSTIMQRMKLSFSKKVRFRKHAPSGKVWQARFWDHIVRDQEDMNRHIDYIHYNPVKHGAVNSPREWRHSSFRDYTDRYPPYWGIREQPLFEGDFGE